MKTRQWVIGLMVAALAVTGHGQQSLTIEQRLEQLEQEIRTLKRQRELDQEATQQKAQETAKAAPTLVVGKDGFGLKSADGNFQMKLRGQVQVDERFYLDDANKSLTDAFLLRRVRPIVEGTLFKDFDFRIMPDFGGGTTVMQDAYLEWTHWPFAKLRAGKFKPQVGLERSQSDSDQWFIENGFPSALLPVRDVGLQLGGDLLDGTIVYAVGIYNGVADGASADIESTGEGKELAARVLVQPFKKTDIGPLKNLGFGIATTYGDQQGSATSPNLPTYKTGGQNTFFSYRSTTGVASNTAFADGQHFRLVPQGYYYWGRLGLLGEYALSSQEITRPTTPIPGHATLNNTAWQVAGSFLLTDDVASWKGVNPRRPFDLKRGGWGAWEVIARVGQLDIDNKAFPAYANPATSASQATAWGVGLNWYLNKNVRFWLDYEQTAFNGGAGTTAAVKDRPDEKALFTRLQLLY